MTSFFSAGVVRFGFKSGAEWHVNCGDMVEIETRCSIPIWLTFGRIQWHVIPEPPATFQGVATWRIQYCCPKATCHIAGCCHLVNSLSWFQSHIAGCSHHDEIIRPSVVIVLHCSCKNYIRHIENRVAIFYFFCFLMQFGLWRTAAFVSSLIHLFYKPNYVWESWLKTNCTNVT